MLSATGRGQHGATASATLNVPFLLTPPNIVLFEACDQSGVVRNMTFGQIATLAVGLSSDRPLQSTTAQLIQSGWAITAPNMDAPVWSLETPPEPCRLNDSLSEEVELLYFRLKLDNSMVDGPGKVVFSTVDLDGLVKSQSLDLFFQHAPTIFGSLSFSKATPGLDLYTNITVTDLDGLDRVICAFNLYGQDDALLTQSVIPAGPEGVFSNELSYRYPLTVALANTSLMVNITCLDNLQQSFFINATVEVGGADDCVTCNVSEQNIQRPSTGTEAVNLNLVLPLALLASILVMTGWLVRKRGRVDDEEKWNTEETETHISTEDLFEQEETVGLLDESSEPELPDIVPEGWTLEEYHRWLDGPLPEGWASEQWTAYVEEAKRTLDAHEPQAEG